MKFIHLWDRVHAISSCLSVRDRWVWVPGRQGGFFIASVWDNFCSRSV